MQPDLHSRALAAHTLHQFRTLSPLTHCMTNEVVQSFTANTLLALGAWLAQAFALPLVTSVGYETPGSFGSWCADLSLPCITAEFPAISSDEASEKYLKAMMDLLRWQPQR